MSKKTTLASLLDATEAQGLMVVGIIAVDKVGRPACAWHSDVDEKQQGPILRTLADALEGNCAYEEIEIKIQ